MKITPLSTDHLRHQAVQNSDPAQLGLFNQLLSFYDGIGRMKQSPESMKVSPKVPLYPEPQHWGGYQRSSERFALGHLLDVQLLQALQPAPLSPVTPGLPSAVKQNLPTAIFEQVETLRLPSPEQLLNEMA